MIHENSFGLICIYNQRVHVHKSNSSSSLDGLIHSSEFSSFEGDEGDDGWGIGDSRSIGLEGKD